MASCVSRAPVTHPSSNRARHCLTSVIWRERVTTRPSALLFVYVIFMCATHSYEPIPVPLINCTIILFGEHNHLTISRSLKKRPIHMWWFTKYQSTTWPLCFDWLSIFFKEYIYIFFSYFVFLIALWLLLFFAKCFHDGFLPIKN